MSNLYIPMAKMWTIGTRKHPNLPNHLDAPEITFSLPMLLYIDNILHVTHFLYSSYAESANSLHVERPFAIVIVKLDRTLELTRYDETPQEFIDIPFQGTVISIMKDSNKNEVATTTIYEAYAPLVKLFPNEPSKDKGYIFLKLFDQIVVPSLRPFYFKTAPEFWKWLGT